MPSPVLIELTQGKVAKVDKESYRKVADRLWHYHSHGYAATRTTDPVSGKSIVLYMHRLVVDCPPDMQVHHLNGNQLDNRRCNLRVCTARQHRYLHMGWRPKRK
jgi:hypothetical protein